MFRVGVDSRLRDRGCPSLLCLLLGSVLLFSVGSTDALTPAQWNEDLSTLRAAIAAHPAPFRNVSEGDFDRDANALAADLPRLSDYQVVTRMAALVALLGDGHSRLWLPVVKSAELFRSHSTVREPKIPPFGYFPVRLTQTADGLVVTRVTPEQSDLLGAQLTAIGGKSASEAEAEILPVIYGDNQFAKRHLLPDFMVIPEVIAAVGIAPLADHVRWMFRRPDGKEVSRDLAVIRNSEPEKWIALTETARPAPERRHWLTKLPNGIIHAHLAEILSDPDETVADFAEKVFTAVDTSPDATLVLDLRDNPGGDNTLNDPIVRGAIRARRLWEPGRFFVLINPGTFSAASNLVTLLERWTPAVLVGEPTGGAPNGYGDPNRTVLPNSGLTLQVSSLYWQVSDPNDKRDATKPLLAAMPTIVSVRAHKDVALDLVEGLTGNPAITGGRFMGRAVISGHDIQVTFELAKEAVSLDLPALRIKGKQFENVTSENGTVQGSAILGNYSSVLHGRITGRRFIGWMEFDGRPYAFAAEE